MTRELPHEGFGGLEPIDYSDVDAAFRASLQQQGEQGRRFLDETAAESPTEAIGWKLPHSQPPADAARDVAFDTQPHAAPDTIDALQAPSTRSQPSHLSLVPDAPSQRTPDAPHDQPPANLVTGPWGATTDPLATRAGHGGTVTAFAPPTPAEAPPAEKTIPDLKIVEDEPYHAMPFMATTLPSNVVQEVASRHSFVCLTPEIVEGVGDRALSVRVDQEENVVFRRFADALATESDLAYDKLKEIAQNLIAADKLDREQAYEHLDMAHTALRTHEAQGRDVMGRAQRLREYMQGEPQSEQASHAVQATLLAAKEHDQAQGHLPRQFREQRRMTAKHHLGRAGAIMRKLQEQLMAPPKAGPNQEQPQVERAGEQAPPQTSEAQVSTHGLRRVIGRLRFRRNRGAK